MVKFSEIVLAPVLALQPHGFAGASTPQVPKNPELCDELKQPRKLE